MKRKAIDFVSTVPITNLEAGEYRIMADNAKIELKQSDTENFREIANITASIGYGGTVYLTPNDSIRAIITTGTASIAKIDD